MRLTPKPDIPALWPEYRERVLAALNRSAGRYDEASVLGFLLTLPGWSLWTSDKFAVVTRLAEYPLMRVCEIIFLGGEYMAEWEHHEETLCAWAQSVGCHEAEVIGRDAWARIGKDRGWEPAGVRLIKEL